MTLTALVLIPLVGGLLAWAVACKNATLARWIAVAALAIDTALILPYWCKTSGALNVTGGGAWIDSYTRPWIPGLGVQFHLAIDGLSLVLVSLTIFLGLLSVLCSWTEIKERVGFFHFNLLWILSGIIGVFLALDLFLFSFFWELMLIPMYFLIVLWGHGNKVYAAVKFFIFTQASGLLMLFAILGLYFVHGRATGNFTFDYPALLGTPMPFVTGMLLMLGFLAAFAVKLPVVPFHTWLPDAHSEAPTAGSVILAGLLLKTGGYGLFRFIVPLFPEAARAFAPVALVLAVVGILYGAVVSMGQTDLKRLIAYTSVSHLGFVLLGVFSFNQVAWQGAVMQMVAHGLSTGALFILVGGLYERIHTRDMEKMGGLWTTAPRMGAMAMFFAMASLGLPGLGNFVAEILVLLGSYQASPWLTAFATLGLVAATIYSLWILQKAFHGPAKIQGIADLSFREMGILGVLVVGLLWIGFYPQPILKAADRALTSLGQTAPAAEARP